MSSSVSIRNIYLDLVSSTHLQTPISFLTNLTLPYNLIFLPHLHLSHAIRRRISTHHCLRSRLRRAVNSRSSVRHRLALAYIVANVEAAVAEIFDGVVFAFTHVWCAYISTEWCVRLRSFGNETMVLEIQGGWKVYMRCKSRTRREVAFA
jgi:hypothetical protein